MSIIYTNQGNFSKVINTYLNALNNLDTTEHLIRAKIYHNLGYTYSLLKNYEIALKYSLLSLKSYQEINFKEIGLICSNCGFFYFLLNKLDSAEIFLNKAIIISEKTKISDHIVNSYTNYALFLANKKDYRKSFHFYSLAYKVSKQIFKEKSLNISNCEFQIGKYYSLKKEYPTSLQYIHKSIISKVHDFNDSSIYSNPSPHIFPDIRLLEILQEKARTFEALGKEENKQKNLNAALSTLKLTAHYMEKLRIGYQNEESKLFISANESDIYHRLVSISYNLYTLTSEKQYLDDAFEYAERSKYGILRELRNEEQARSFAGVPDSILVKERRIKERLYSLSGGVRGIAAEDTGNLKKINEEIFTLTLEQEALIRHMEKEYPDYYRLKYDDHVVSPKELQYKLNNKEILLEYTISGSHLYTFFITKSDFRVFVQDADSLFYSSLSDYKRYLHSPYILPYDSFCSVSNDLYKKLISPVEPYLPGNNLIVVPDAQMGLIAFESLIRSKNPASASSGFTREDFLIKHYPIGYAFSATLFTTQKNLSKRKKPFIGFTPDYRFIDDSLDNFLRQ
ncbi:MAG: CHAT domain-containing protein [Bacteroidales bacterium]|nr:CHAT domain-containing protein [Bacteroidales bacterium]